MDRSRRQAISVLGLWPVLPWGIVGAAPASDAGRHVVAAWKLGDAYRVGILALQAGQPVRELIGVDVPTRAHGVWVDPAGRLCAVARRPGDWLLRWAGPGRAPRSQAPQWQAPQWQWAEPMRAFNGHAVASADGRLLLTAETDLDSGAGLIGVRDMKSLVKLDEWPTHGRDPHQLVRDPQAPGWLMVANGGIATMPETGRAKLRLDSMDSSLVRIDTGSNGRLVGQWRLADPRLSLRHLAWSDDASRLGIALQAEHDDPAARAAAPVLATFDGQALLAAAPPPRSLAGYGGDIAASVDGAEDGFAIGCPRADGIAHYSTQGEWRGFTALPQACALAADRRAGLLCAGGNPAAASLAAAGATGAPIELGGRRLDNHWSLAAAGS